MSTVGYIFLIISCLFAGSIRSTTSQESGEGADTPTTIFPQIQALEDLLKEYEKQLKKPYLQWSCTKCAFKKGDNDPVIRTVKKQLSVPSEDEEDKFIFDEDLEKAAIDFQKYHFLNPDGVIGPATCRALNMTMAERIRKIKLNLKRWRKLSPLLKGRYIIVNVPTYHLNAMEGSQTILSQAIVVGMKSRPTPIFSTTMTRLVLNPAWYVPDSIFFKDKLKRIQQDPNYLTRNSYIVSDQSGEPINPHAIDWYQISGEHLPYRIRQLPGPQNALGRIKFYLEGNQGIYLHDTSQPDLLKRCPRAFSSGCVRLSKPIDLALWALDQTNLESAKKFQEKIDQGDTKTISFPTAIPVYFIYITVWVDENGQVLFSDDPYDLDEAEMKKEDREGE